MIYQVRSRLKITILLFITVIMIGGAGTYFYLHRHKEPTHGEFVYNTEWEVREDIVCGYLRKPAQKDNSH